ncbi:MAG: hypothetical protein HPY76_00015 [Anaerolineae bacterium]|nr:hypothetical protein [Anaerolineae bacterium]
MKPSLRSALAFLAIFATAVAFRLTAYGAFGKSVAMLDSGSYLATARLPLAPGYLSHNRSASYPLLFKLLNPVEDYEITLISQPYFYSEPELAQQPGFDRVVIFQLAVGLLGWGALAWALWRRLRSWLARVASALLIFAFALSPQVVDWDSIIMTESLAFSLFALVAALGLELTCQLAERARGGRGWAVYATGALFLLASAAWIFLRDTNYYYFLPLLPALAWLAWRGWRAGHVRDMLPALLTLSLLLGLIVLQQRTFGASNRWEKPLLNNLAKNILPYDTRVAFFEQRGMPVSAELLAVRGSAEYNDISKDKALMAWVKESGLATYQAFLLDNPHWAFLQVYDKLDFLFSENLQPFFVEKPEHRPLWMIEFGNLLHPTSSGVILVSTLLTGLVLLAAARTGDVRLQVFAGNALWWLLGAGLLFAVGVLGEVRSEIRHAAGGALIFRLMPWLLVALLGDVLLTGKWQEVNEKSKKK